jgi:uncharacterized protein YkwD
MKRRKSIVAIALSVITAGSFLAAAPVKADSTLVIDSSNSPVEVHSEDEIKSFFDSHPFDPNLADTYAVAPNVQTETAGDLSDASAANALNTLNMMRYVAGISSDVTNDDQLEQYAMAGTTLLTKVGSLNHRPDNPGVSDGFYQLGYRGTSSSNLEDGYATLSKAILNGWMDDSDDYNWSMAGHRRWCLDTKTAHTGFGHSGSYTAMYDFGIDDSKKTPDLLMWPAQTMPVDFLGRLWTLSYNTGKYSFNASSVQITLTVNSGGKTSVVQVPAQNISVDNACSYGDMGAVNFKPGRTFGAGDTVTVNLSGMNSKDGCSSLQYTVKIVSACGGNVMYRSYNPNSGEHFYTSSYAEASHLWSLGWNYEGIGWVAPYSATNNKPVYRLYNPVGGEHHYTLNSDERNNLISAGWNDEGVGWYSDGQERTKLYREYNPNAFANNHNYTTNPAEHKYLVSLGWRDEGTAWYGVIS